MKKSYLLTISIGPVQDFISASKTSNDLWSSSFLLSYLMGYIIKNVKENNCKIIFPATSADSEHNIAESGVHNILELFNDALDLPDEQCFVPSLPNKILIRAEDVDIRNFANGISDKLRVLVREIGDSVVKEFPDAINNKLFFQQLETFPEIYWCAVDYPCDDNISTAYALLNKKMAAVKNLRLFNGKSFNSADSISKFNEKDVLTGKEENVIKDAGKFHGDVSISNEAMGAISLLKRVWHNTYLIPKYARDEESKRKMKEYFKIKDVQEIAKSKWNKEYGSGYYAIIAFDGDKIGKWVSGENVKESNPGFKVTEQYLNKLSEKLGEFAGEVPPIIKRHNGGLVYAGGDDVLALLPVSEAVECAVELHNKFAEKNMEGKSFEASCGIAFGHTKTSMSDIIKEAQFAEKTAKLKYERNSMAIVVLKRSGEILNFGMKFGDSAKNIFEFFNDMKGKGVSHKFLYDFIKVLELYLDNYSDKIDDIVEIINAEFKYCIKSREIKKQEIKIIIKSFESMSQKIYDLILKDDPKKDLSKLKSHANGTSKKDPYIEYLIGLFQVAAWLKAPNE